TCGAPSGPPSFPWRSIASRPGSGRRPTRECAWPWTAPGERSASTQLDESDLRRHEQPNWHPDHSDATAHVELAAPPAEVAHDVFGDQPPRRPPEPRHVELPAVDMPRQGERDAARGGAVERPGPVGQENPKYVGRCAPQGQVDVVG